MATIVRVRSEGVEVIEDFPLLQLHPNVGALMREF